MFQASSGLGNAAFDRWEAYVRALHQRKPFNYLTKPPAFLLQNVLGKGERVKIPENRYLALCKDLGVRLSAPDPDRISLLNLTGVPNGPLDYDFIKGYIASGQVTLSETIRCPTEDMPEDYGQSTLNYPRSIHPNSAKESPKS